VERYKTVASVLFVPRGRRRGPAFAAGL